MESTIRMGPIGETVSRLPGWDGEPSQQFEWNETGHNAISHINVSFDKNGITSIQFGYVEKGALVISRTYGSTSSNVCSRRIIRLNHESEFVTGISGETYRDYISSLAFHTNLKTHYAVHLTFDSDQNYGPKKMEFHSGILDRHEFLGFFGTEDYCHLCSIGFYAKLDILAFKTIKKEND